MFGWHKKWVRVLIGIKFQSLHFRPLEAAARALGTTTTAQGARLTSFCEMLPGSQPVGRDRVGLRRSLWPNAAISSNDWVTSPQAIRTSIRQVDSLLAKSPVRHQSHPVLSMQPVVRFSRMRKSKVVRMHRRSIAQHLFTVFSS
jgi:hypothetical protein